LIQKPSAATTVSASLAGAGASPTIRIAANPEPTTNKPNTTPIFVKTSPASGKRQSQADESPSSLPSPLALESANDSKLSGLMTASSNISKPTLATIRVSQGVSQGLLIKRVQPKYPQAALSAHIGGVVLIEATINKEGNVTNLKVLNGDQLLAHAALEAVRQWRYKPYYLNNEPVEIDTQITVNFKAN
jgi:TonB family protein